MPVGTIGTAPFVRVLLTIVTLGTAGFASQAATRAGAASADSARCDLNPPRHTAGLEACLLQSPRNVELLLELGAAHEEAGRITDAVVAYQRAVSADPRDADARVRLGNALWATGDLRGAQREGAAAAPLRPRDRAALDLLTILERPNPRQ